MGGTRTKRRGRSEVAVAMEGSLFGFVRARLQPWRERSGEALSLCAASPRNDVGPVSGQSRINLDSALAEDHVPLAAVRYRNIDRCAAFPVADSLNANGISSLNHADLIHSAAVVSAAREQWRRRHN